jgi:hypothetical protein
VFVQRVSGDGLILFYYPPAATIVSSFILLPLVHTMPPKRRRLDLEALRERARNEAAPPRITTAQLEAELPPGRVQDFACTPTVYKIDTFLE